MSSDALAIVVVTHDSAESLPTLLDELVAQLDPGDELVVVDNASSDETASVAARGGERVQVVENEVNLGFGAGCHEGARSTDAPLLLFINPDCRLEPHCLERLRATSRERPEWGAWQAAVLLPDGRINTDGNVVHYIGIGWAGDCGKPIEAMPGRSREVGFPSGAAVVVRRSAWDELGGFDPTYFMYSEDLDLGLRLWLAGSAVGVVPDARVIHSYEFDKGARKWYWLERNRWRTVLSVYPLPLLILVAPALLTTEFVLLLVAAKQGWLEAKLRADLDVLRGLPAILHRRRSVQARRSVGAASFSSHLAASLDSEYLRLADRRWVVVLQRAYWRTVQLALAVGGR